MAQLSSHLHSAKLFAQARKTLLDSRTDYDLAIRKFKWPQLESFNWALDWFDAYAEGNSQIALQIVQKDHDGGWIEDKISFEELSEKSSRIARHFQKIGMRRGDRFLVMLPNRMALWETFLAAMKLGVVIVPTTNQATQFDLEDRVSRGKIKFLITEGENRERVEACSFSQPVTLISVGEEAQGKWLRFEDSYDESELFSPTEETRASDPLLLYFTSGTTARPKLVQHTQQSYPVGHLSTMYWIGLKEGSVHLNISSPGWAKHAWSSFFAPWNAGATILVYNFSRFSAADTLEALFRFQVSSLCAPPTVWRMLIADELGAKPRALTDLVGAGEPLNPEVIESVERSWGLRIRDGFGQTETTLQIGNTPGQKIKLGSMGRTMPGYEAVLLDSKGNEVDEGEIALRLNPRPTGLMAGYADDPERTSQVMDQGYYRTGDEATRDADGYFFYVGRGDDVFKSSDYRISPFELESVLIEHEWVNEAAVVPSPHPLRLSVPKAFVVLKNGVTASPKTAKAIFDFCQTKLPPYKLVRRLQFSELPKTISGKIRRVELRNQEREQIAQGKRGEQEFWLEDF